VPVDELPGAVDAPVDVGNPEGPVTQRPAVDADMASLEADRVGEISAGGDDKMLRVYGIGAGPDPRPGPRLDEQLLPAHVPWPGPGHAARLRTSQRAPTPPGGITSGVICRSATS
jgi:hypothetical protein